MWNDLVDIIKLKGNNTGEAERMKTAKSLNALYGSICNCQVAFHQCKYKQNDVGFIDLIYALDSFIYSLQNLNPLLGLFEPALEKRLKEYIMNRDRILLHSQPREQLKFQLKLLRSVVSMELDVMQQPLDEFGSFTDAVVELANFISKTYRTDEIFHSAVY